MRRMAALFRTHVALFCLLFLGRVPESESWNKAHLGQVNHGATGVLLGVCDPAEPTDDMMQVAIFQIDRELLPLVGQLQDSGRQGRLDGIWVMSGNTPDFEFGSFSTALPFCPKYDLFCAGEVPSI